MPTAPTTVYRRCPRCDSKSVVRKRIIQPVSGANGQPKNGHTRQWVHFTLRCTAEPCAFRATTGPYYEAIYANRPTQPSP